MARTAVDICNLALLRIGSSVAITSITSPTNNEERTCAVLYPMARDFCLQDIQPTFSRKVASGSTATGTLPQGWAYIYTYPSDCLEVTKVYGTASPRVDEPQPFTVINLGTTIAIATNQASAVIEYVTQVTDPDLFDDDFVSALGYYLASELSMPISSSADGAKAQLAAYEDLKGKMRPETLPEAAITDTSAGAVTLVGIANAAFMRIGHNRTISSVTEHTNEARLWGIYYPRLRDAVLRAAPWAFATKQATLASGGTAGTGWSNSYTLPTDCLFARRLVLARVALYDPQPRFHISGRNLWANQATAVLEYTSQVTDATVFDSLFTSALICALADAFGSAIGAKPELVKAAQETYNQIIANAIEINKEEGLDTGPDGSLVTSTSALSICNMAILHLGGKMISSLTEPTREARACSVFYNQVRDKVLRAFPWNFATKRQVLDDSSSTLTPATNWTYTYNYPTDCVNALAIVYPGNRLPLAKDRIPFEVAYDTGEAAARVIYSDLPGAELIYTSNSASETLQDTTFTDALAWAMAAAIGNGIEAKPQLIQGAMIMAMNILRDAQARNSEEGEDGPEPDCEFLTVRG